MKTNLTEVNSFTRQLDVTVDWNLIQEDFTKDFNRARLSYSMPGFRKGKVPANIVKRKLGPEIEAHFTEHSIDTYYRKALDELKLHPINQATIDDFKFKEGDDLSFTALFEVEPEITLPKYQKKFKLKAIRNIADEEDVLRALAQYQEQNANIKTIDSGAESGHFIRGDFQGLDERGLPIVGSVMEKQYIRLGFGLFKDEAETVFLGKKEGDEVTVTIPGKETNVTYQVTITKIEEQILPELDDELAKTLNENANTLEELKVIIKKQIQDSLDREHKETINKEIINYFVEKSTVDAPDSMISNYLSHVKEDMEKQQQPVDDEGLKEKYKSHAEWNIKWYLIKGKLIENESLDIPEEDLEAEIRNMISRNGEQGGKIKSFYRQSKNRKQLYDQMLNDKLFEKISEFAKVTVVEQSTEELRNQKLAQLNGE